ncbi:PucR family transcriptional regulator [Rhodococcus sp. JS3073]|uniref:PucR family transcriptional regulator n=1 Tax=Rhodococcus sp. JS3073 TaxID=3002901 RepID=UPI002286BC56|nr:PucR family transcriptional regulator [Rhodococcus sp. JS3073]WAM11737.1 PucR family transcriptional regulator [Rhodococcus sp. JS3073]
METEYFRLVDLLLEQDLGLTLESDGDPNVQLVSAHPIEIEAPARWLEPRTLMLTTGTRFVGQEKASLAQRQLVRELVDAGVSALGYGVGVVTDTVPRALIDEANRHHFAVISVPAQVRFMDVVSRVAAAAKTTDSMLLRRTLQMQNHLLEAMASPAPEADLVARLAGLLRSSVVLYSEVGDVVASAGEAPLHLIRAQLRGRTGRLRFRVGRWAVSAYSIAPGGQNYWFAVASKRHEVPDPLAAPAVEVALRLLNTIERSRYRATTENRAIRAALVRTLASGEIPDLDSVIDRLEMLRFGRQADLRMVSLTAANTYDDGRWTLRSDTLLDALEQDVVDLAHDSRLPLLLAQADRELLGIVPATSSSVDTWIQNLQDGVACGFSGPFTDLRTGRERVRDAQCARRSATRSGSTATRFEDVGISDWLLAGRATAPTSRKAAHQLAPLIDEHPDLLDFLRQYFANDLDVSATATQCALHPNTVRYRIKKIEDILRTSLRSPAVITEIHLSLECLTPD